MQSAAAAFRIACIWCTGNTGIHVCRRRLTFGSAALNYRVATVAIG
jgi:hypothetical protein